MPLLDVGLEVGGQYIVPVDTDEVDLDVKTGEFITLRSKKRTLTNSATSVTGSKEILHPSKAVRVRARGGGASLVSECSLRLDMLLPERSSGLRRQVRLT